MCIIMYTIYYHIAIIPKLDSREHRTGWEKCFAETFIKPVLTVRFIMQLC